MKIPSAAEFQTHFKSEIWHTAAAQICRRHNVAFSSLRRAEQGESIVFLVDEKFAVKIYVPSKNGMRREKLSLETARTNLKIPEIVGFGEFEGFEYLVTTQIEGELMTRAQWLQLEKREQIRILAQLADGLKEMHRRSDAARIDFDWDKFIARQAATCFERQKSCGVNEKVLEEIPGFLAENLKLLAVASERVFLHGDVHFGNLRLRRPKNEKWEISGLFDFADSLKGFHEYDFLAVGLLMIQGQGDLQREFFRFFDYADAAIDETLRKRLMLLTMFYEWSDLRRYAVRLRTEAVDYSLDRLERAIWSFAD